MRRRAFLVAGLFAVLLLSGCGSGSTRHQHQNTGTASANAQARGTSPTRRGLTLSASGPGCSGTSCTKEFSFTTGHPSLTRTQALKLAYHLARQSPSLVVRDLTCHVAPAEWQCTYINR